MLETAKKLGEEFCEFVNQSYSPFHVVDLCRKALTSTGFISLAENTNWELKTGQKYLFSRNNSTLVAFSIGDKFDPNDTGFKILGAHTDSPQLKLAPISKLNTKGFNQSCVECYGGGLWHTWFDRDLKLGGKIIYRDENKVIKEKLIAIPKSIAKIINIAPHLQTMEERKKFDFNKETHLRPIFSTDEFDKLLNPEDSKAEKKETKEEKHYSGLLKLICKESGLKQEDILDWDLRFSDSQPSQLLGINEEFVSSGKIDNLYSTFSALKTLTSPDYQFNENKFIDLIFLFDHEEIGSESAQGAASPIILETLNRIFKLLTYNNSSVKKDSYEKALRRSYILSADCAHSIHPCYSDKHQTNHQCKLNAGIVLKINANQRYASDAVSQSLLRIIADKHNVPLQDFIVKNDSPCGSTIGPISAGKTGIKTADIGAPQLGMHSIRETAGTVDMYYYVKLFEAFFKEYEKIQHTLLDS